MKRTMTTLGVLALSCGLLLCAGPLFAAHGLETSAGTAGLGGLQTSLPVIIGRFINALLGFVGVIVLLLMIYAGFLWMTAAGNEDQVGKAKKIIVGSIIGAALIMGAYAITSFVVSVVAPSGPAGEMSGDEDFIETSDPLEEALTPLDMREMPEDLDDPDYVPSPFF